jgi:hypothetical protein
MMLLVACAQSLTARSRPYRVLVVIGDQWTDPGSYNIDDTRVSGQEFQDVISMLKVWGVPFDILRLDQQILQINRFLNGAAEANYSCIIWMANPDTLSGAHADYGTLRRAVLDYGMSLIALFDCVKAPVISDLVGIRYHGYMVTSQWRPENRFIFKTEHEVTQGMRGLVLPRRVNVDLSPEQLGQMERLSGSMMWTVRCESGDDAQVLATLGGYPQVVVRELSSGVRSVWIGGQHDCFERFEEMRQVFRNALVWCLGYGFFNDNFDDAFILKVDDFGASEHAYSVGWNYPTPSKESIIRYLIEPLEKYDALLVQFVTPGYANPETHMVEVPWNREPFTDAFGNFQDYASTKAGLDEGLKRGVFEIQAHRAWTHMTPDLESPPGPWWDAPLEGEMAHPDWWQETYDQRRDRPVPSNEMLFVYRVGRDAIQRQFGVAPLAVRVRSSGDLDYDNGRLAAIAGYGVAMDGRYIGHDHTIQLSLGFPEVFGFHGLELAYQPELPRVWIEMNKDRRWIGYDETCAYLHARIDAAAADGITARVHYSPHYSRYFKDNASTWTLELSDWFREKLGRDMTLVVDGEARKITASPRQSIKIDPGAGTHTVELTTQ